jgi:putative endonuclease
VVRLHPSQRQFPDQEYTGATEDLKIRLSKYRPWTLIWYSAFPDKLRALEFEKYLKSHSGRAFAKKRLK